MIANQVGKRYAEAIYEIAVSTNKIKEIYEALNQKVEISEDFIKHLHSLVEYGAEEAGKYRTIQNYIGDLFRVVYTPCSPQEVPCKMKEYVQKVRSDWQKNKDLMEYNSFDYLFEHYKINYKQAHEIEQQSFDFGELIENDRT